MTTKRQKSVGGRNRDQYTATAREEKKAGREADGGREAWKSDTGRKRAKDGQSHSTGRVGGERDGRMDEWNPNGREKSGEQQK